MSKLANTWAIATRALKRNKLQSSLTMLGMAVGVATVLAMMALGTGAQRAIQDQVRAAGMNMLIVTAGNFQGKREDPPPDAIEMARSQAPGFASSAGSSSAAPVTPRLLRATWSGDSSFRLAYFHPEDDPFAVHDHPTARQRLGDSEAGLGAAATLTLADAHEIRKISGVQYVSEGVHENVHILNAAQTRWFTRVHGDDTELPEIRRAWTFLHGRFFSAGEQKRNQQVVVLGTVVAKQLFGNSNPVGQTVTLWKQSFKVVGVVGSSSWLSSPEPGDDQFDAVYIPVTTMQHLLNLSKLNDITVTTVSTGDVTRVAKSITALLRQRHGINANKPDDFTVASQASKALTKGSMTPEVAHAVTGNVAGLEKVTLDQLGKSLDRSSRTMTALLVSIATVSLIVGGIGIMNIMLLSVTERTREIGVRRAVGAQQREVLAQFLMESLTLSLTGGAAGVVVGVIAAILIAHAAHWSTTVPFSAIAIAFCISTSVGIFFGYYPAREASRVPPLASLRYE
jgi:putative ABC transport system permease protein